MIALDTSALVAIALREPGQEALRSVLLDESCAIGAPTLLELYLVLRTRKVREGDAAQFCRWVQELGNVTVLVFDEALLAWAQIGYDRYGKDRGSGAGLNTGDCMSYAVAKHLEAELLFTGGDFRSTDVAIHPSARV